MKKILILLIFLLLNNAALAVNKENYGLRIVWVKNDNNGRYYIIDIFEDSPAIKSGAKIGDEILQVNGIKLNRNTSTDINNLINDNENLFFVRDYIGNKKKYTIKKDYYNIPTENNDELFNLYWNKIIPNAPQKIDRVISISRTLLNVRSLDKRSRQDLHKIITQFSYIQQKKLEFKSNYDLYKKTIKNQDKLKQKLEEVTNKMLADIQREKELEYQRQLMLQQQAMQAQMIRQQQWQNASLNAQRELQRYQENRMRQYEIDMKYAPKFEAPQMQLPQTYQLKVLEV